MRRTAINIHYPRALLALLATAVLAAGLLAFVGAKPAWAADRSFKPLQPVPVGSNPTTVTSADFNGDGKGDLAAQNFSSNSVSVRLGNGDGSFQAKPDVTVGSGPTSVTSADFNGDGKADLAVSNQNSRNVSVSLGSGDGTFQAAPNSPFTVGGASWASPSSVISADFNSDGKADLAVANLESHDVSVLLGNGDGNFQAAKNVSVGSNPNQVISADFNGDGKPDLATADAGRCIPFPSCGQLNVAGGFSVRLGNGDGTFQSGFSSQGDHSYSITTEDFNGDHKADLAVPLHKSKAIWVKLGNGDGTFQTAQVTRLAAEPIAVTAADFDDDSKADLAVTSFTSSNVDNVSLLWGNGNGSFQAAQNFPTGDGPDFVIGANLNTDSYPDLAVANEVSNNVSVLLNTPVDAPPMIDSVSPADGEPEVALGANVEATFSEAMDPSTITDQTFTLTKQGSSNPVAARVLYDSANKKATLYPAITLEADTSYAATIKSGSSGVKDLAGNALLADKTWTFSTVDTTAPQAPVIVGPANDYFDSDGNFVVSGTAENGSTVELLEGASIVGRVTADGSGNWSVSLSSITQGEHTYTARAKDAANNTSGLSNPLEVTVDATAPKVESTLPVPGARGVARSTSITATFSDRMDESTLTAQFLKLVNTATGKRVNNAAISYDDATTTLTLDPFGTSTTLLAKSTRYKVTIATGVKNRAGISFDQNPGTSGNQPKSWTFTTGSR
jgi:hypothetical protein